MDRRGSRPSPTLTRHGAVIQRTFPPPFPLSPILSLFLFRRSLLLLFRVRYCYMNLRSRWFFFTPFFTIGRPFLSRRWRFIRILSSSLKRPGKPFSRLRPTTTLSRRRHRRLGGDREVDLSLGGRFHPDGSNEYAEGRNVGRQAAQSPTAGQTQTGLLRLLLLPLTSQGRDEATRCASLVSV